MATPKEVLDREHGRSRTRFATKDGELSIEILRRDDHHEHDREFPAGSG
jgi:hypothetical protein